MEDIGRWLYLLCTSQVHTLQGYLPFIISKDVLHCVRVMGLLEPDECCQCCSYTTESTCRIHPSCLIPAFHTTQTCPRSDETICALLLEHGADATVLHRAPGSGLPSSLTTASSSPSTKLLPLRGEDGEADTVLKVTHLPSRRARSPRPFCFSSYASAMPCAN